MHHPQNFSDVHWAMLPQLRHSWEMKTYGDGLPWLLRAVCQNRPPHSSPKYPRTLSLAAGCSCFLSLLATIRSMGFAI